MTTHWFLAHCQVEKSIHAANFYILFRKRKEIKLNLLLKQSMSGLLWASFPICVSELWKYLFQCINIIAIFIIWPHKFKKEEGVNCKGLFFITVWFEHNLLLKFGCYPKKLQKTSWISCNDIHVEDLFFYKNI